MVNFKEIESGVDTNFSTKLNTDFRNSLKVGHLARIDQIRLMQDATITEQGDDLDNIRDIFTDSDGYNGYVNLTNTTAQYDTAGKYYAAPKAWVEIEATAIVDPDDFSINNCSIGFVSTGKWIVTCSDTSEEVQRAQIYKTLFYGSNGSDPRASSTYITTITALRTNVTRDVGKQAHLALQDQTAETTVTYTGTFVDTSTNDDCSSWSYCQVTNADGDPFARWEMPSATTLNGVGDEVATSDETGTDLSADETNNPATCQLDNSNGNAAGHSITRAIILCSGDITWAGATGTNVDFLTDNSIPLLTAATETEFIVETDALTSTGNNIDSIFITAQKEDDGTNLITYNSSSDNGTSYTSSLSLDQIKSLTSTLGNDLIVQFVIPNDADAKMYGYSLTVGRVS